jgi:hypothetical protein
VKHRELEQLVALAGRRQVDRGADGEDLSRALAVCRPVEAALGERTEGGADGWRAAGGRGHDAALGGCREVDVGMATRRAL